MAKADAVISGVVRGLLPYAALAAVGVIGYSYLNKKGYLNGIKNAIDTAADIPSQIVTGAANFIQNKTPIGGVDKIRQGDFIGGAQQIVRTGTPIGLIEKGANAAADALSNLGKTGNSKTLDEILNKDKAPVIVETPTEKPTFNEWLKARGIQPNAVTKSAYRMMYERQTADW